MKKYKFELFAKRTKEAIDLDGTIETTYDAAAFCRHFYFDDINIFESFFVVLMKNKSVVGWAKIAQGGVANTTVDVKIIAKYAIDTLCTSVILCHNHPSGDLKPSILDKQLTKQTKTALELFNIRVNDHIIITEKDYFSFQANGLL